MSVVKLSAVDGKGTALDRSQELTEAIKDAVYSIGEGMPVAMVIGCIELAKLEILEDQK